MADDGFTALGIGLVGSHQARAGDQAAVDAGDTWGGLMDRAAGHLAHGVLLAADRRAGLEVVVVAGKGNNGGDGWAAAHRLRDAGAAVTVASVVPLDRALSDEAAAHRDRWVARRGRTVVGVAEVTAALERLDPAGVVVDCLLGTGISGAPRGDVAAACAAINAAGASGVTVVACDMPSGVNADTGHAPGDAVWADLTVTMGKEKRGLLLHPGAVHAGRVMVGSLGHRYDPPARDDTGHLWSALTAASAQPPVPDPATEKRDRGTVLLVAGSVGAAGAAILATRGALHAGAGLTTLATPAHVQRVIAPVVPSAMTVPLRHQGQHVGPDAIDQLPAADFDAVVAGPGLGPVDGTRAVVDHLLANADRLVLDADALNVYRDDPQALADHAGTLVLTPHARELARLGGGADGPDAWEYRVERVPQLAADLGAIIVAKGPGTIVAAPEGWCAVTPLGGPELGVGGTGDVLAGMIGAAIATVADGTRPAEPPGPADAIGTSRTRSFSAGTVAVAAAVARAVWLHAFTGAWLAAGRPPAAAIGRQLPPATALGFGPSSRLPAALPDAARVLADLAAADPRWPLEVPW